MSFPETKHVHFKKNLLDKVVCQLRFPTILQIDSELPSHFQNLIRDSYPAYHEQHEAPPQIRIKTFGENSQTFSKPLIIKNHTFSSEDGNWIVNLTRDFMAITTSQYGSWVDFVSRLRTCFNALIDIYHPAFFTRTGLRYIDVVDKEKLDIEHLAWSDLLQPKILGVLSDESIGNNIIGGESIYDITLDEKIGSVRLITSIVKNTQTNKNCFMIDSDFYWIGKHTQTDLFEKLDFFHSQSNRLIQWAITPELQKILEPTFS